jgi:hypothetical protein
LPRRLNSEGRDEPPELLAPDDGLVLGGLDVDGARRVGCAVRVGVAGRVGLADPLGFVVLAGRRVVGCEVTLGSVAWPPRRVAVLRGLEVELPADAPAGRRAGTNPTPVDPAGEREGPVLAGRRAGTRRSIPLATAGSLNIAVLVGTGGASLTRRRGDHPSPDLRTTTVYRGRFRTGTEKTTRVPEYRNAG